MHLNLQVQRLALLDDSTILNPGNKFVVYPSDLRSLIYDKDLTGEVVIIQLCIVLCSLSLQMIDALLGIFSEHPARKVQVSNKL